MARIDPLGPEPLPQFDVHARLADLHVVDVRLRSAFAVGHIPSKLGTRGRER